MSRSRFQEGTFSFSKGYSENFRERDRCFGELSRADSGEHCKVVCATEGVCQETVFRVPLMDPTEMRYCLGDMPMTALKRREK